MTDNLEPIRRVFRNAGLYSHAADDLLCRSLVEAMTTPSARPECFEFALDFLGAPEEAPMRAYIENLEARLAAPQPQPLFLLHTGAIYGNERGDWDVEANSGKAVDAYCDARPGQTIGLYAAPQPQPETVGDWVMVPRVYTRKMMNAWNNTAHMTFDDGWAAILAAAPERPQPDWRHLWSECRRVMDKWHAQAVELGYDGVRDLLEKAAPQPQPQAVPVVDGVVDLWFYGCEFLVTFDGETTHPMKLGVSLADKGRVTRMVFELSGIVSRDDLDELDDAIDEAMRVADSGADRARIKEAYGRIRPLLSELATGELQ